MVWSWARACKIIRPQLILNPWCDKISSIVAQESGLIERIKARAHHRCETCDEKVKSGYLKCLPRVSFDSYRLFFAVTDYVALCERCALVMDLARAWKENREDEAWDLVKMFNPNGHLGQGYRDELWRFFYRGNQFPWEYVPFGEEQRIALSEDRKNRKPPNEMSNWMPAPMPRPNSTYWIHDTIFKPIPFGKNRRIY